MNIEKTNIQDLLIIHPVVHADDRGYFLESYHKKNLENHLQVSFLQDNESKSQKGVLRGLHFQEPPFAQENW